MSAEPSRPSSWSGERLIALVTYGLLIAAPFTLGLLAVLAILIAYARRGGADPLVRGHYNRQIRCFWTDLIAVILAVGCAWAALAAGIGAVLVELGQPGGGTLGGAPVGLGAAALGLACAALLVRGVGGMVVDSAFGAMRLASGRPARKTRA